MTLKEIQKSCDIAETITCETNEQWLAIQLLQDIAEAVKEDTEAGFVMIQRRDDIKLILREDESNAELAESVYNKIINKMQSLEPFSKLTGVIDADRK